MAKGKLKTAISVLYWALLLLAPMLLSVLSWYGTIGWWGYLTLVAPVALYVSYYGPLLDLDLLEGYYHGATVVLDSESVESLPRLALVGVGLITVPVVLALAAGVGAIGWWGLLPLAAVLILMLWATFPNPQVDCKAFVFILGLATPWALVGMLIFVIHRWGAFTAWWNWLIGHFQ